MAWNKRLSCSRIIYYTIYIGKLTVTDTSGKHFAKELEVK